MATITLLPGQKVVLAARTTKSSVNAPIVGLPVWTNSDATLVSITPSVDGRTCEVRSKGGLGSATVTCTATGAGAITDNVTITIVAATTPLATALTIGAQGPPA